jgi:hypothetical protein
LRKFVPALMGVDLAVPARIPDLSIIVSATPHASRELTRERGLFAVERERTNPRR